jgi:hypothetical protein
MKLGPICILAFILCILVWPIIAIIEIWWPGLMQADKILNTLMYIVIETLVLGGISFLASAK